MRPLAIFYAHADAEERMLLKWRIGGARVGKDRSFLLDHGRAMRGNSAPARVLEKNSCGSVKERPGTKDGPFGNGMPIYKKGCQIGIVGSICMYFINTIDGLFDMLDRYTEGVNWNAFYTKRDKPAPFLKYDRLPDKCVVDLIREHKIKNACEFGCGEGRNAIYLAKNCVDTEAYDLSEIAIENAKRNARESKAEKSSL